MVRFNENNEVIRNEEYTAILAGIQLRETSAIPWRNWQVWRKRTALPWRVR
ncbi:MAG: hypothetical protein V8R50_05695 [Clostridia bacterium]